VRIVLLQCHKVVTAAATDLPVQRVQPAVAGGHELGDVLEIGRGRRADG
jgi:hypothetical protein